MLGSIYIGLSGMNAFSNALRQISNNITNINSTGYKSSDLLFTNMSGTGAERAELSGQGVTLANPRLDFSQGELRQTGRDLDLAIDGAGFLVLLRDAHQFFARTGSFEVNEQGDIVLAGTDYKLSVLDDSGNPTAISVEAHRTSLPQATTTVAFTDNLSSTSSEFNLSSIRVFDAQGAADNWRVRFTRDGNAPAGEWTVIVTNGAAAEIGRQTLRFINGVVDPATDSLTFEDTGAGRTAVFDFSGSVTSFSSGEVSTLRVASVDGFGTGEITSIGVNDEGELEISYSNEQKLALGPIAIASFRNPQYLEQRDGGIFAFDRAMGPDFLTSAHENVGRVVSGRLEASNVDLSREFGELILVQRGFQASSQVVSVSNDMIQQLFGIRGQ